MKKILVPIDFSENSKLALKHAFQVANQLNSTISLLHVYQIETRTGSFLSIDQLVQGDREGEMSVLIEEMKPLLGPKIKIESFVKKGASVETICQTGEKLNVDIIIMGTTGAGGMKKLFLGSTASNVIKNTPIPVLAIPQDFQNFKISNITLALDNKEIENATILRPLVDLVNGFKAELKLVTVIDETHPKSGIDPSVEEYLKNKGVNFTFFIITASEIIEGIQNFVKREKSDLLCVVHRSRGLFESIFEESVAKQIAFDSRVPLLVLRG